MKLIKEIYQDLKELLDKYNLNSLKCVFFLWDFKLTIISFFFFINNETYSFILNFINFLDPFFYNGFFIFNLKIFFQFTQNITIFFGIKFLLSISFLVLIRGGTPRYRYDYLTKLGWLKFLGFIISVFFFSIIFFYIF